MKDDWQQYLLATRALLAETSRQTARSLTRPHKLLAWPLWTLFATAALYQILEKALWLLPPVSFPYPTRMGLQNRMRENPIDTPQRVTDWIAAQPFDALEMLVVALLIVGVAAVAETVWLSLLLHQKRRPNLGTTLATACQWLVLRGALAIVFLTLILAPMAPLAVRVMGLFEKGGAVESELIALALLALVAAFWAMAVHFVWGLLVSWLSLFFLPLRLMVDGGSLKQLRWLSTQGKRHWRGLLAVTILDWGVRTALGVAVTAATFFLYQILDDRPLVIDLAATALVLPIYLWLRLLGPSALAQLHPALSPFSPPPPPLPPH